MPDVLVVTAENDVLRDKGEAYARKLWETGARVICSRYIGTIRDFVMFNAIAVTHRQRAVLLHKPTLRWYPAFNERERFAREVRRSSSAAGRWPLEFWALQFGAR